MLLAPLRLKKNEDRRLRAGHLWVFSNEVDVGRTPLDAFEPGDAVSVEDSRGKIIGSGYVNPHSLICARLISRAPQRVLGAALLTQRLTHALALRTRLFDKPYYRLVFGEGDGLPGLVVDRYGATVVVQITTAGMERAKTEILSALHNVLNPDVILLRNDSTMRALEGLPSYVETAHGTAAECLLLEENGVCFEAPLLHGQKTGWFYDHRINRALTQHHARGGRVLDVFSYLGAFGVQAAVAGASEVLCIDASEQALEFVRRNAALNQVTSRVGTLKADAFDALKSLHDDGATFDLIVLDPPAFIKRKKDHAQGLQAYRRLNQMALALLAPDGILVSASCSYHLERAALLNVMLQVGREHDCTLQIIAQGHQGPDHPVHPAIPETDYLKAFFAHVSRD
ncbi:MAG: class I SAM-dependent rRNA methyltransferase [Gammaproteobacteria bacterium]|nr:class I SAM-dependent rRNA methyltransferase [Gammaproteobacteria bacterium]